jgi:hypothetical protein
VLAAVTGQDFPPALIAAARPLGPSRSPCATEPPPGSAAAIDRALTAGGPDNAAAAQRAAWQVLGAVPAARWQDPALGAQAARARVQLTRGLAAGEEAGLAALRRALGLDRAATEVGVRFAGLDRARIETLRAELAPLGWAVPQATRDRAADGQSRLAHAPDDAALAARLRADLAALGWTDIAPDPQPSLRPGTLVLWLSP